MRANFRPHFGQVQVVFMVARSLGVAITISARAWPSPGPAAAAPFQPGGVHPHVHRVPRTGRDSPAKMSANHAAAAFLLRFRPRYSVASAALERGRAYHAFAKARSRSSGTGKNPSAEPEAIGTLSRPARSSIVR